MKTPWNSTRLTKFTTTKRFYVTHILRDIEIRHFWVSKNCHSDYLKRFLNLAIGKFQHWNVNGAKILKLWNCYSDIFEIIKSTKLISRKILMSKEIIRYHKVIIPTANNKITICRINDKPNLISRKNHSKVENKYIWQCFSIFVFIHYLL